MAETLSTPPESAPADADHNPRKETRKRRATLTGDDRPKKRTVSAALRKRTGRSCDLCKTRRVKCIRPNTDAADDTLAPCENCTRLKIPCQSELPRKTRIYGSVESLSARYRVLEALVKHFCPERNTDDTGELIEIASEYGISIPDLDPGEVTLSHAQAPGYGASIQPPEFLRSSAPAVRLSSAIDATKDGTAHFHPRSRTSDGTSEPSAPSNGGGDQYTGSGRGHKGPVLNRHTPEERLYPNTQGVMSYLGPSSSFRFMISLRKLLGKIKGEVYIREHSAAGRETFEIQEAGIEEAGVDGGHIADCDTPAAHAAIQHASQQALLAPIVQSEAVDIPTTINGRAMSDAPSSVQDGKTSFVRSTRETLPPKEVADVLVEAFFDRVHVNYVIFHRGLFQTQYESLFTSPDDLEGDADPVNSSRSVMDAGWICSIYMVFVFGHRALTDSSPHQAPRLQHDYVKLVQKLLYRIICSTSLSNVQALLLVQLYQHNSGERNTAWMLLSCACRMGISMGMHRDGVRGRFSPIIRELRRRVWWTMYTFEKQQSLTLGRPSSIPEDGEVNVGLPNEGMMDGKTYMPPGLLGNMLGLVDILVQIRRTLLDASATLPADPATANPRPLLIIQDANVQDTRNILRQLQYWFCNIPPNHQLYWNAEGSNHYRAAHLLHLLYYHARQVITRSYLLKSLDDALDDRERASTGDSTHYQAPENNAAQLEFRNECVDAALEGCRVFDSLWNSRQVDGVAWVDIYWAYHSGIMLLVNLLRERHQGDRSRRSISTEQQLKDAQAAVDSRAAVKRLVNIMHRVKLCKTMGLFAQVIVKLARVVGVDTESTEDATDHSEAAQASGDGSVTNGLTAIDGTFDTLNLPWTEPPGLTDDFLAGWTDADFLFPMGTDGGFDDFGWTQM